MSTRTVALSMRRNRRRNGARRREHRAAQRERRERPTRTPALERMRGVPPPAKAAKRDVADLTHAVTAGAAEAERVPAVAEAAAEREVARAHAKRRDETRAVGRSGEGRRGRRRRPAAARARERLRPRGRAPIDANVRAFTHGAEERTACRPSRPNIASPCVVGRLTQCMLSAAPGRKRIRSPSASACHDDSSSPSASPARTSAATTRSRHGANASRPPTASRRSTAATSATRSRSPSAIESCVDT